MILVGIAVASRGSVMSVPDSLHTLRIVTTRPRSAVTDAAELVRSAGRLLRAHLREGLTLSWDTRGGALPVHMSRRGLEQVLFNLVFHAESRITSPGHISVEARRIGARGPIGELVPDPGEPRSFVRVRVVDSGPALTADERRQLFDAPGPAGSASTAVAYSLVRAAGGLITVDVEPETLGTTLNIFLPLADTEAGHPVTRHG
jgi:signal transduction histidine kinase